LTQYIREARAVERAVTVRLNGNEIRFNPPNGSA